VAIRTTRRPDNHHQALAEQAVSLKSWFAVVAPVIPQSERGAGENRGGGLEIQPTFAQRPLSFSGIVGDRHDNLYAHRK